MAEQFVKFGAASIWIERVSDELVHLTINADQECGFTSVQFYGTPDGAEALKNALENADSNAKETS